MQIGAHLPLSRILAVITGQPRSVGAGGEPVAGAETLPKPVAAQQPHPLASVQMLVTLAAVDPQREGRRAKGGSARKYPDDPEGLAAEPGSQYAAAERIILPAEPVRHLTLSADPALNAGMQADKLRAGAAPTELDIEV
ncbi:hypothetical protein [Blastomonas aquatica]|uniref:Uncharacterized protein n=1 Tax=Blastomonas aquatica TaxID=1510276 RepID=A0ABQ1JR56_9SPHN|nr:hypothetical protein [Blastomonas aquatica]GGB74283.1 hypothetical protein GCM10010833_31860 [Blastomonas aquatica]